MNSLHSIDLGKKNRENKATILLLMLPLKQYLTSINKLLKTININLRISKITENDSKVGQRELVQHPIAKRQYFKHLQMSYF
jgi:hypothetical protein